MLKNKKGMNLVRFLIEVLVAVVVIPIIAVETASANVSATTKIIFGLFEIFAALGVLYAAAKEIGYGKKG